MLPTHAWPLGLLLVGLAVAVTTPFLAWRWWYDGNATWPSLISNFSATFFAFVLALAWDRRQRGLADAKESAAELRRGETEAEAEQARRTLEARRRFSAIALELARLEASIGRTVKEQSGYKCFFPDLPSGSWQAGSGPLGLIIADYGLMADLATFYGHVDELRWRLRFKAQPGLDDAAVSPIIDALARQMLPDVEDLLRQVRAQVTRPDVEPVLGQAVSGSVVSRRQFTGTIHLPFDDASRLADETPLG